MVALNCVEKCIQNPSRVPGCSHEACRLSRMAVRESAGPPKDGLNWRPRPSGHRPRPMAIERGQGGGKAAVSWAGLCGVGRSPAIDNAEGHPCRNA